MPTELNLVNVNDFDLVIKFTYNGQPSISLPGCYIFLALITVLYPRDWHKHVGCYAQETKTLLISLLMRSIQAVWTPACRQTQ